MVSWLLSALGLAALRSELAGMVRRARQRAMLLTLAALLWLAALGFAFSALVIWLAGLVGPLAATAIVAAVFAVIALGLQLAASATARRDPSPTVAELLAEGGGKDAKDGGRPANTLGSLAIVALAGYVIGRHLFRR